MDLKRSEFLNFTGAMLSTAFSAVSLASLKADAKREMLAFLRPCNKEI